MGIFAKLFGRKDDDKKGGWNGRLHDLGPCMYATCFSVITNLAMLPDLRVFKTSLHVPTVNNRLGLAKRF